MPGNIKVLHYPPLEFLRSYPTVGPTGELVMDINGLAGSWNCTSEGTCLLGLTGPSSRSTGAALMAEWDGIKARC